jgi:hypothetical protein
VNTGHLVPGEVQDLIDRQAASGKWQLTTQQWHINCNRRHRHLRDLRHRPKLLLIGFREICSLVECGVPGTAMVAPRMTVVLTTPMLTCKVPLMKIAL